MNRDDTFICLIRHGESHANVQKLVTGTPHDGLTKHGVTQAQAACPMVSQIGVSFDSFYVSQWRRAQETASILFPDTPFIEDTRLGETYAGKCTEWLETDFQKQYPDFRSEFDPSRPYPDGESHLQLYDRTIEWFLEVAASSGTYVAAVTHAGPIACLLHYTLGISMDRFPCLIPANAGVCLLKTSNAGQKAELLSFNYLLPPTAITKKF